MTEQEQKKWHYQRRRSENEWISCRKCTKQRQKSAEFLSGMRKNTALSDVSKR